MAKAEGILNGHATNLGVLNDKLSASDENSTLSLGALKVLLKDNATEIRKLWDLTNKTNKPNIAKNTKAISGVKASVAQVDKKAAGIEKKAAGLEKTTAGLEKKIVLANGEISGTKTSITALKTSLANNQDRKSVV